MLRYVKLSKPLATRWKTRVIMAPMAKNGQTVGSMGADRTRRTQQQEQIIILVFQTIIRAGRTPIDPLREEIVMSLTQYIGPARNILQPGPEHCRMVEIDQPILTNDQTQQLKHANLDGFRGAELDMTFAANEGADGLEPALGYLFDKAEQAIDKGANILVLSDRALSADRAPIPSTAGRCWSAPFLDQQRQA